MEGNYMGKKDDQEPNEPSDDYKVSIYRLCS